MLCEGGSGEPSQSKMSNTDVEVIHISKQEEAYVDSTKPMGTNQLAPVP